MTFVVLAMLSATPASLYEEGSRLYDVEKYEEAIEAFKQAYVLSPNPGLLYNIAQAYRLWGHCRDSLNYYRRYLAQKPNAPDRAAVQILIGRMSDCADKEPPPPEPAKPAPPPPEP